MRLSNVALVAAVSLSTIAASQEKKMQRAQLPAAVQRAIDRQAQGATIKGYSTEKENGKTYFEAEMMVNGHSKDVLFDASGAVVEIEEQVAIGSLAPAVIEGLQAKAGQGKIVQVESISKHGQVVAYEAKVHTAGKLSEVQVGPDGKLLDHEE